MDAVPIRPTPGPTTGHHFASLQTCPHKAWCDYFLPSRLKAEPPGFLLALQREGLAHEEAICESVFPGAVRVPERAHAEERHQRTLDAMRSGAPAILQAYLATDERVGIADVLELVGPSLASRTGHLYRVGEFKRARRLMVSHVLQAAWYSELLDGIQGTTTHDAFFVLGDGSRLDVSLGEAADVYADSKSQLERLRDPARRPGPHLCKACLTCPWRSVCVPELIAGEHVSLVPGISRAVAARLHERSDVSRWPDLVAATDEQLRNAGIPPRDWATIRAAASRLAFGAAVTREPLNSAMLRGLRVMSIEFGHAAAGISDPLPLPEAVWLENPAAEPTRIGVSPDGVADLSPVSGRMPLAVYGATELAVTHRLLSASAAQGARVVDLLDVIENLVHAPLHGLELGQVAGYVRPSLESPADGPSRLTAMRAVINWIAAESGTAA